MPGNWEGSDRRSRLPSDWPKLVAETRRLAKGRCQKRLPSGARCPRAGTDADHIQRGDDHRQVNLQWLCEAHHKAKTAREGTAGRWGKKKITPRTEGPHPGRVR